MDKILELVTKPSLLDALHLVFLVSVVIVLVAFNKRLKVLENLPSIKDFLRSYYAKKRLK